jgi:hypothetical protein
MHVSAILIPGQRDWRWRIVNNAGEIIEESRQGFPNIADAVAAGTKRLVEMNVVDRSERPLPGRRSISSLRRRPR